MFSATWPKDVRQLAAQYQREPVFLNVGSLDVAANPNITQFIEVIEERDKTSRLLEILSHIGEEVSKRNQSVQINCGFKRKYYGELPPRISEIDSL